MATYAQGYERKNSDSKNISILLTVIITVVVLAIGATILINALTDHTVRCYENEKYADCFVNASKNKVDINGNKQANDDSYYLYICDKCATTTDTSESDSDAFMDIVLDYLDACLEDDSMIQLVLLNIDDLDDTSKQNWADTLCYGVVDNVDEGHLYFVENNCNEAKGGTQDISRIMTTEEKIEEALSLTEKKTLSDWID